MKNVRATDRINVDTCTLRAVMSCGFGAASLFVMMFTFTLARLGRLFMFLAVEPDLSR
jgi:hypothetical protein